MNYHNTRRSPSGFRSGAAPNHRAFDSPPSRSPGRGGGFRPMGGEGPGEFGFNGHQPPPPLVGQKRGFPVAGRGGGSPVVWNKDVGCEQPLIVRFADPKRPRQGDSRSVLSNLAILKYKSPFQG
ncbi:hypothetical protein V8G54_015363 [Vigna mungo]|uniref:Uncharacterized protein n=1 Tax=Vigna mungo TaxID=3915 RepID=A0AAQ3RZG1_VIGMU